MDRVKNSVDVSPFLLVEAAGDSEVDSDPTMSTIDLVVDDGDDAESCSCDTSDHSCVSDIINGACSEVEAYQVNYNVVNDDHDHVHDDDDDDEEEEEEEELRSVNHGFIMSMLDYQRSKSHVFQWIQAMNR